MHRLKQVWRRAALVAGVFALTMSATTMASAAPSSEGWADSTRPDRAAGATHPGNCVILIGNAEDPGETSPVLHKECSRTRSMDDLKQSMATSMSSMRDPWPGTPLVKFYQHINYEGYAAIVYGQDGTCDHEGYYISMVHWFGNNPYWQNNVSSIAKFGSCNFVTMWTARGAYEKNRYLPLNYLGSRFNDNVGRMRVKFKPY